MSLTYERTKVLNLSFLSQTLIGMTNLYKKSSVSKDLKANFISTNVQGDIFCCPKLFGIK